MSEAQSLTTITVEGTGPGKRSSSVGFTTALTRKAKPKGGGHIVSETPSDHGSRRAAYSLDQLVEFRPAVPPHILFTPVAIGAPAPEHIGPWSVGGSVYPASAETCLWQSSFGPGRETIPRAGTLAGREHRDAAVGESCGVRLERYIHLPKGAVDGDRMRPCAHRNLEEQLP